ncbi:MAG TPA: saccharopine dehydrogenase NADP-binding domain-containing protein [Gammaproteobacteria bacterium]|nr:saccharopine dehydrogenase NADP-binding domain-containing protein [Gammaproteobacteria bacterium]
MLSVLVLGGYGFFGLRIAKAFANDERIRLVVAGRDARRAAAAARELGLSADHAVELDARSPDLAARLQALAIEVLVHTAGPFQGQRYDVAEAAVAAGCHYIDIADGRRFVSGMGGLDERARRRGVSLVSGASSVPALSSAVVDRYAPRFRDLAAIRVGIASGARAPGLAAVRGIFGYLGAPFTRLEDGAWVTTHGWMDLDRHRFPAPLGKRWMASCDVPDLELFPQRYPGVRTVTFHAGYASTAGHLAVYAIAALVRAGIVSSGAPFAAPLNRLSRVLEPLVSHRGGMFVTLEGTGHDGRPLALTWHLLAAQNHGPHIPCGAAIALVRKLASGQSLPPGAVPCVGLLSIEAYLEPLRALDVREVAP